MISRGPVTGQRPDGAWTFRTTTVADSSSAFQARAAWKLKVRRERGRNKIRIRAREKELDVGMS